MTPRAAYPLRTASGEPAGVVHLSAEYWPYARSGGLAEAVTSLARYQAATGLRTTVLVPLYRSVRSAVLDLEPVGPPLRVHLGPRKEPARLFRSAGANNGPEVLFIAHPDYFNRAGLYGESGADYPDNHRRFAFFVLAALEALPLVATSPLVLHAHDWHAALAPVYLRTTRADDPRFRDIATVLSVHNGGYQGHFGVEVLEEIELPSELYNWRVLEWYGRVNFLKGGLKFADAIVTVSPTHAQELKTPDGGFGLHEMFRARSDRLVGILNGIDYTIWNPACDGQIVSKFSAAALAGKARCKAALQALFGLPERPRVPVFGMAARLVQQKGLDLILNGRLFQAAEAQFIFLGQGEPRYERGLRALAARLPDRVAVETNFTDRLEHELIAGADMLLMPCLYEPCGLTQMRAQRYGTLPVARRVGGLADTIEDGVTGFLFDRYEPEALASAVAGATAEYHKRRGWRARIKEAMTRDFSWEHSEQQYLELYRRVLTP